jgi:hypothetical protein
MPYIVKAQREIVDKAIEALAERVAEAAKGTGLAVAGPEKMSGVVNYAVTMLLQKTMLAHDRTYASMSAAIGTVECCKLELYRRMIAPYENVKANQNGDVFDYVDGGQLNAKR